MLLSTRVDGRRFGFISVVLGTLAARTGAFCRRQNAKWSQLMPLARVSCDQQSDIRDKEHVPAVSPNPPHALFAYQEADFEKIVKIRPDAMPLQRWIDLNG